MSARYCIDTAGQRSVVGVNLSYLLFRRLCRDCQAGFDLERATSEDPAVLAELIAGCCSSRSAYLSGRTPLAEVVFRILAASGDPVGPDEIAARIRLAGAVGDRNVDERTVLALLESDRYYGYVRDDGLDTQKR